MDIHQASVRDHQGIELLIPQSYLDRTHFFWLEILLYSSILETHNCKSHVPRSFLKNCIRSLNFNLNVTNTVFKVGNTEILQIAIYISASIFYFTIYVRIKVSCKQHLVRGFLYFDVSGSFYQIINYKFRKFRVQVRFCSPHASHYWSYVLSE